MAGHVEVSEYRVLPDDETQANFAHAAAKYAEDAADGVELDNTKNYLRGLQRDRRQSTD